MPELLISIITLGTNIILVSFVSYYLLSLRKKEKKIQDREQQTDTKYHHIVDEALAKERQILDDATHEADQIITGANYIKQDSQESIDKTLKLIVAELQKDSLSTSQAFMQSYTASLQSISQQSVHDFQATVKQLQTDLQQQIASFHQSLLPNLEKELDEYKQMRLKQTDQMVASIVQKTSQEVLNKTIPLEDHHTLMTEALEKAKKEGVFS